MCPSSLEIDISSSFFLHFRQGDSRKSQDLVWAACSVPRKSDQGATNSEFCWMQGHGIEFGLSIGFDAFLLSFSTYRMLLFTVSLCLCPPAQNSGISNTPLAGARLHPNPFRRRSPLRNTLDIAFNDHRRRNCIPPSPSSTAAAEGGCGGRRRHGLRKLRTRGGGAPLWTLLGTLHFGPRGRRQPQRRLCHTGGGGAFCGVPLLPPLAPRSTWATLWAAAAALPRPWPSRVSRGGRDAETAGGELRHEPRPAACGTAAATPATATSPAPAPVLVDNNHGDVETTAATDSACNDHKGVHKGVNTVRGRCKERGCGKDKGGGRLDDRGFRHWMASPGAAFECGGPPAPCRRGPLCSDGVLYAHSRRLGGWRWLARVSSAPPSPLPRTPGRASAWRRMTGGRSLRVSPALWHRSASGAPTSPSASSTPRGTAAKWRLLGRCSGGCWLGACCCGLGGGRKERDVGGGQRRGTPNGGTQGKQEFSNRSVDCVFQPNRP